MKKINVMLGALLFCLPIKNSFADNECLQLENAIRTFDNISGDLNSFENKKKASSVVSAYLKNSKTASQNQTVFIAECFCKLGENAFLNSDSRAFIYFNQAAKLGSERARYYIHWNHIANYGKLKTLEIFYGQEQEAINFLEKASLNKNKHAAKLLGEIYLNTNYKLVFEALLQSHYSGNLEATFQLGRLYYNLGDYRNAREYFICCDPKIDSRARNYGERCYGMECVDIEQAYNQKILEMLRGRFYSFKKAKTLGFDRNSHVYFNKVSKNLIELAANNGVVKAQFFLGACYLLDKMIFEDQEVTGIIPCHSNDYFSCKNHKEAIKWLTMAANKGHKPSMYVLSMLYSKDQQLISLDKEIKIKVEKDQQLSDFYRVGSDPLDEKIKNSLREILFDQKTTLPYWFLEDHTFVTRYLGILAKL